MEGIIYNFKEEVVPDFNSKFSSNGQITKYIVKALAPFFSNAPEILNPGKVSVGMLHPCFPNMDVLLTAL